MYKFTKREHTQKFIILLIKNMGQAGTDAACFSIDYSKQAHKYKQYCQNKTKSDQIYNIYFFCVYAHGLHLPYGANCHYLL